MKSIFDINFEQILHIITLIGLLCLIINIFVFSEREDIKINKETKIITTMLVSVDIIFCVISELVFLDLIFQIISKSQKFDINKDHPWDTILRVHFIVIVVIGLIFIRFKKEIMKFIKKTKARKNIINIICIMIFSITVFLTSCYIRYLEYTTLNLMAILTIHFLLMVVIINSSIATFNIDSNICLINIGNTIIECNEFIVDSNKGNKIIANMIYKEDEFIQIETYSEELIKLNSNIITYIQHVSYKNLLKNITSELKKIKDELKDDIIQDINSNITDKLGNFNNKIEKNIIVLEHIQQSKEEKEKLEEYEELSTELIKLNKNMKILDSILQIKVNGDSNVYPTLDKNSIERLKIIILLSTTQPEILQEPYLSIQFTYKKDNQNYLIFKLLEKRQVKILSFTLLNGPKVRVIDYDIKELIKEVDTFYEEYF